jgi:hypothetical protein
MTNFLRMLPVSGAMKLRTLLACLAGGIVVTVSSPVSGQLFSNNEAPAATYTQPAENLILIIADIQRHLADDVYRFPYPQDVNGQNVFRSAIVQLSNYEKLYPGRNSDIVALGRAQAYERLCDFQPAGLNYTKALETEDAALKKLAQQGFERCKAFSEVVDRELDQSSLRAFEDALKLQIADLDKLSVKYNGTSSQCLASLERERTQMRLAEFYAMFRFMKPYTTEMALDQLKKNLEANNKSKLRYTHHLMKATLNYELAREYTVLHDPEGPDFNLKEFETFANSARSELAIVEQADGYAEKQEGRALLTALESFIERTRDRAR